MAVWTAKEGQGALAVPGVCRRNLRSRSAQLGPRGMPFKTEGRVSYRRPEITASDLINAGSEEFMSERGTTS